VGFPVYALLDFILLFQPSASSMSGGGGGASGGPAGCAGGGGGPGNLIMIGTLFAAMYFLMIRPQQKQQKEHESMLKKLKTGDIIRTDSGIRGEVVKLGDRDAEILIADRTKINILRSRIAGVEGTPAGQATQAAQPSQSKE
jgi:preprotein translocase subunit YajC